MGDWNKLTMTWWIKSRASIVDVINWYRTIRNVIDNKATRESPFGKEGTNERYWRRGTPADLTGLVGFLLFIPPLLLLFLFLLLPILLVYGEESSYLEAFLRVLIAVAGSNLLLLRLLLLRLLLLLLRDRCGSLGHGAITSNTQLNFFNYNHIWLNQYY